MEVAPAVAFGRQRGDSGGHTGADPCDSSDVARDACLGPEIEELTGNDACGDDIECQPDNNGDGALPDRDMAQKEFREEIEVAKALVHGVDKVAELPKITERRDEDQE